MTEQEILERYVQIKECYIGKEFDIEHRIILKVGNQEFAINGITYTDDEKEEMDFMRRMLAKALLTIREATNTEDRNSIALPNTVTDPDASVRAAFDAAIAEAEQIVIVPFASNKENEGRIRREVVAMLRRLEAAIGVEVGE